MGWFQSFLSGKLEYQTNYHLLRSLFSAHYATAALISLSWAAHRENTRWTAVQRRWQQTFELDWTEQRAWLVSLDCNVFTSFFAKSKNLPGIFLIQSPDIPPSFICVVIIFRLICNLNRFWICNLFIGFEQRSCLVSFECNIFTRFFFENS